MNRTEYKNNFYKEHYERINLAVPKLSLIHILTTGEGEMFVETDDDFFERIDRIMAGENETRKNMIKMLLYASDDDIEAFDRLVDYYISLRAENKKD